MQTEENEGGRVQGDQIAEDSDSDVEESITALSSTADGDFHEVDVDYAALGGEEEPSSRRSSTSASGDDDALVIKEGWLEKRGEIRKSWKKRFFVLNPADNTLKYYKRANKKTMQGQVPLDGCSVQTAPEEKYGKKHAFEVHTIPKSRIYVLVAESGMNAQDWMHRIRKTMLRIRRERSRAANPQRVAALLEEQDAAARHRLTQNGSLKKLEQQLSADEPFGPEWQERDIQRPPSRSEFMQRLSRGPRRGSFVLPNGAEAPPDASDDEKYNLYLEWLHETNRHQRKPTGMFSHDMNSRLLPSNHGGMYRSSPWERCVLCCCPFLDPRYRYGSEQR